MMILIALLLPSLLGVLILAVLFRADRACSLLTRLCLAYPLGAGVLTLQMFVFGIFRVPLTLGHMTLPLLVEVILIFLWMRINKVSIAPKPHFQLWEVLTSSEISKLKKTAAIFLVIWIGVKIVTILAETDLLPIYAWDAWTNWSVGAKLFYYNKSLLLDASSQDFFAGGAVLRITSYPLHNPLMQTWISLWLGGFDEVQVKFWTFLYLVSLVVFLYDLASKELGHLTALALTIIFLSSPLLSYHAIEVYSDLPLGTYLFFALAAFLQVMKGKYSYTPLIGLFSAEAMFTKDEALFFAVPLFVSAFIYFWQKRTNVADNRRIVISLLIPFLLIIPWYAFKFSHGLGLGADSSHREFTFHPEVIIVAARILRNLENFNVVIIFLPFLFVLAGKPDRVFWHLITPVASYAVFFFMVYMFDSFYYFHFMNSSIFSRNILTYYPSLVLLTALLIKKIRSDIDMTLPRQEPRVS